MKGEKDLWGINKRKKRECYQEIRIDREEYLVIFGKAVFIMGMLTLTFYKSFQAIFLLFPVGIGYIRYEMEALRMKKYDRVRLQFKDAMQTIASDMQAGYSFPRALADAVGACERLYGNGCMIRNLLLTAVNEIEMNTSVERALWNMAESCGIQEVYEFEEVVRLTYQYGGNMPSMLRQLSSSFDGRVAIREEILAVTASARYEAYVMDVIPPAIILYLNLTGPVFLSSLYTTLWGRCFMTVSMVVYLAVVGWQFSLMKRGIS